MSVSKKNHTKDIANKPQDKMAIGC